MSEQVSRTFPERRRTTPHGFSLHGMQEALGFESPSLHNVSSREPGSGAGSSSGVFQRVWVEDLPSPEPVALRSGESGCIGRVVPL